MKSEQIESVVPGKGDAGGGPTGSRRGEYRVPRGAISRTLSRICERLDRVDTATVPYVEWNGARAESTVTILSVWAVGSFARGSLDCGDLDLVVRYVVTEGKRGPPERAINRVLLGKMPRVRVYTGTPAENSSGVEFLEARLVWRAGDDWANLIASIEADPAAERFERPSDRIPFRLEQMDQDCSQIEHLLAQEAEGVLQWTFAPIETVAPIPLEVSDFYRPGFWRMSKDAISCVSYLAGYFGGDTERIEPAHRGGSRRNEISYNGCRAVFGRPDVPAGFLNSHTESGLVVFPKPTKRGPNGFWHIRRGPNHPLVLQFANIQAWVIAKNDQPVIAINNDFRSRNARCARLFLTEQEVVAEIGRLDCAKKSRCWPLQISGADVLEVVSSCDLVEVVGKITPTFVNQFSPNDLISVLKGKKLRRQRLFR